MKRYIKYGLFILTVLAAVGLVFYILKKPKESVLSRVPSDVTFCFTINKEAFLKEPGSFENIQNDSFYNKVKSRIPSKALLIFSAIGLNHLGDIAFFGKEGEANLAWIGNNEKAMYDTIKKFKWHVKNFKDFDEVKISPDLYLCYRWPLILLSNHPQRENEGFFCDTSPKINKKEFRHPKTDNNSIFGFIIPGDNLTGIWKCIPVKGKAFVGLNSEEESMEIRYIQPGLKLQGNLGVPKEDPPCYGVINWPLNMEDLAMIGQIPDTVISNLNQLIKKPVSRFYAEVLDTLSSSEKIITYEMDREFKLTQKVIYAFKTFPGLHLEFFKSHADRDTFSITDPTATNIGLDIFRLNFIEKPESYVVSSEDTVLFRRERLIKAYELPIYYLFANFDLLKTDPFWKPFTQTKFKKMRFHAEALEEGSMYVLRFERN